MPTIHICLTCHTEGDRNASDLLSSMLEGRVLAAKSLRDRITYEPGNCLLRQSVSENGPAKNAILSATEACERCGAVTVRRHADQT